MYFFPNMHQLYKINKNYACMMTIVEHQGMAFLTFCPKKTSISGQASAADNNPKIGLVNEKFTKNMRRQCMIFDLSVPCAQTNGKGESTAFFY